MQKTVIGINPNPLIFTGETHQKGGDEEEIGHRCILSNHLLKKLKN